jgi:hypothetical protein
MSYGSYDGCRTFLRIMVRDEAKKACILEKKIAKHSKCCNGKCFLKNQEKQCAKLARDEATLATIEASLYGPETYETAVDSQFQTYSNEVSTASTALVEEQAKTQRTLIYLVFGGVGVLLLANVLKR